MINPAVLETLTTAGLAAVIFVIFVAVVFEPLFCRYAQGGSLVHPGDSGGPQRLRDGIGDHQPRPLAWADGAPDE